MYLFNTSMYIIYVLNISIHVNELILSLLLCILLEILMLILELDD